jgi:hypothetical protein
MEFNPFAAFIAGSVLADYPQVALPTATPHHPRNLRMVQVIAALSTPALDH